MKRPGCDFRGRPLIAIASKALHDVPELECDHVDHRVPTCEQDAEHVVAAIRGHLLGDEAVERAAFAVWVADLGTQSQGATDAELRFGWEHMPPNHRRAWIKRARLILKAALDA